MNSLTIGRYVPYNTFLHRIDPRCKLAVVVALMIAVFIPLKNIILSYIGLGFLLILVSIFLYVSKLSLHSIFTSMKSLWFLIFLLLLLYSLIPSNNPQFPAIFTLGTWTVYWDSCLDALVVILRLLIMLCLTMILTATTKPLELTYALEWYLNPLKIIQFPAAEIAMTISIALRFIPTLLDDASRIMKAQESRGVDFAKSNIFKKIVSLTSLIVPLFVSAFTRSEELANAMECRCYNPESKRTRYRILKWSKYDSFALIFGNLILICFILISVFSSKIISYLGISIL